MIPGMYKLVWYLEGTFLFQHSSFQKSPCFIGGVFGELSVGQWLPPHFWPTQRMQKCVAILSELHSVLASVWALTGGSGNEIQLCYHVIILRSHQAYKVLHKPFEVQLVITCELKMTTSKSKTLIDLNSIRICQQKHPHCLANLC